MTPDERDRLLTLELNAKNQEMSTERIATKVDALDGKVDELLKAAHMGQGAWWMILRIGAVLAAICTAGVVLVNAAAWVFDKFHK